MRGVQVSRSVDEKLWIGPDICVTVLRTMGNRVLMNVEAPPERRVWRGDEPPAGDTRLPGGPTCLKPGEFPTRGKADPRSPKPPVQTIRP